MNRRISKEVVLQEVNDKLRKEDLALVECQHLCQACLALGDYYLMNLEDNTLVETHVDLKKIALDHGCIVDPDTIVS